MTRSEPAGCAVCLRPYVRNTLDAAVKHHHVIRGVNPEFLLNACHHVMSPTDQLLNELQ